MGAVKRALPHLARPCDRVAKEVLAFVSIMLFNANEPVQVTFQSIFKPVLWNVNVKTGVESMTRMPHSLQKQQSKKLQNLI